VNASGTAAPTALPEELLSVIGTTGSTPHLLARLTDHERARRLLTLRALLDAVRAAPPGTLPPGTTERVLRDWRLLEAAERADPAAARRVVHYPHTGAWAERCLRALTRPGQAGRAALELPHLAALAAAASARAGLRFSTELPVRDGMVTLPTLGGYRLPARAGHPTAVTVEGDSGRLRLSHGPARDLADGRAYGPAYTPARTSAYEPAPGPPHASAAGTAHTPAASRPPAPDAGPAPRTVEVRRGPDGVWRSAAPEWQPLRTVGSGAGRPVLIDDTDPYRDEEDCSSPLGLPAADPLDIGQYTPWRANWHDAQRWLRLGDGTRAREAEALLDCFVPLAGLPSAQCSATRGEAFGAVLCSTPRSGLELAATVVHELQHTKLLAVSHLATLHTADGATGYWAPWRRDARPFDGLLQGAYAHLGLADFHLAVARSDAPFAVRDRAWADHCRCRQQVEMALPQLLAARWLTPQGRTLVKAMSAHHTRLKKHVPPDGHLARAAAYTETARMIWRRTNEKGGERPRHHADGRSAGEHSV
jgi:hypothetical protein